MNTTTTTLCFVIVPSVRVRRYLRRWRSSADDPCSRSPLQYHHARELYDEVDAPLQARRLYGRETLVEPYQDRRLLPTDAPWPSACVHCGAPFTDEDVWQLDHERLYRREDDGGPMSALFPLRQAPAGALVRAWWHRDVMAWRGPDGECWACQLPDGTLWVIDGPASSNRHQGPAWRRRGRAPTFTVEPSVQTGTWHGYLREGVLIPV